MQTCLNDGEDWELALHAALEGAALVLPIVSQPALDGIAKNAPTRRDNLLMGEGQCSARGGVGACISSADDVVFC